MPAEYTITYRITDPFQAAVAIMEAIGREARSIPRDDPDYDARMDEILGRFETAKAIADAMMTPEYAAAMRPAGRE